MAGPNKPPLSRRIAISFVVAAIGAAAGFFYAQQTIPAEKVRTLAPMYATAGALIGILVLRLTALIRMILSDLLRK